MAGNTRIDGCGSDRSNRGSSGQIARTRRERTEKEKGLTVDAIVAATAILWAPSLLITGDVDDLRLLTEGSDVRVISV